MIMPDFASWCWRQRGPIHRRPFDGGPVTDTPYYWRFVGAAALIPGVTILAFMQWRLGGWKYPIRAVREVWDDWYQAFFA
jgi:hypothetical protein